MKPKEYLKIRKEMNAVRRHADTVESLAYDATADAKLPDSLRPATPTDIVVDAVLWYPDNDEGHPKWCIVDEVRDPGDAFKAFISDGCRYGLEGCFVEVESPQ